LPSLLFPTADSLFVCSTVRLETITHFFEEATSPRALFIYYNALLSCRRSGRHVLSPSIFAISVMFFLFFGSTGLFLFCRFRWPALGRPKTGPSSFPPFQRGYATTSHFGLFFHRQLVVGAGLIPRSFGSCFASSSLRSPGFARMTVGRFFPPFIPPFYSALRAVVRLVSRIRQVSPPPPPARCPFPPFFAERFVRFLISRSEAEAIAPPFPVLSGSVLGSHRFRLPSALTRFFKRFFFTASDRCSSLSSRRSRLCDPLLFTLPMRL